MISIGLDLSLAATGVCLVEDGKLIIRSLIKSKPVGDRPEDELKRLLKIVADIEVFVEQKPVDLAVIEGLAFMARNTTALVQLSGLNYLVREMLFKHKIPFAMVAPSSLKKFITGKGVGDKNIILLEIYKKYAETILDDNEADAFGLAQLGQAIQGTHPHPLGAPQKEVADLVRKQL